MLNQAFKASKSQELRVSPTFLVFLFYGLLILLLALVGLQPFVPVASLTRDPMAIAKGHFYWGALSNVGVLLWCAATTFCFFGAFLLHQFQSGTRAIKALLALGAVTFMLLMDDLFQLHEAVFSGA